MTDPGLLSIENMSRQSLANMQWWPVTFHSGCDVDFVMTKQDDLDETTVSGYHEKDVLAFTMAVRQMTQPLFPYNGYFYERIARGNILIVGTVVIAYTFKKKIMEKLGVAESEWRAGQAPGSDPTNINARQEWNEKSLEQKVRDLYINGPGVDASTIESLVDPGNAGTNVLGNVELNSSDIFEVGENGMDMIIHFGASVLLGSEQEAARNALGRQANVPPERRIVKLHNVELNMMKLDVRATAQPIAEAYNFTARAIS